MLIKQTSATFKTSGMLAEGVRAKHVHTSPQVDANALPCNTKLAACVASCSKVAMQDATLASNPWSCVCDRTSACACCAASTTPGARNVEGNMCMCKCIQHMHKRAGASMHTWSTWGLTKHVLHSIRSRLQFCQRLSQHTRRLCCTCTLYTWPRTRSSALALSVCSTFSSCSTTTHALRTLAGFCSAACIRAPLIRGIDCRLVSNAWCIFCTADTT